MMNKDRKIYVVEGSGDFPVDMLRYDHSWPLSPVDSTGIQYRDGVRRITLETNNVYAPAVLRWESFLWNVVVE